MIPTLKENKDNNKLSINSNISKYFDYQASTPTDKRVVDAMMPYFNNIFGNPHSRTHSFGWESEKAMEDSRGVVGSIINAAPSEIIFTSGATEANNLALKGFSEYFNYDLHIITSQTEHKSVLDTCRYLETKGVKVTYLPVKECGRVCQKKLKAAITPKTKLVSIGAVNGEIGTIEDLKAIGKICHDNNITFHTDAVQGFGKIPIDVKECNIGMLSLSGHKVYGPKGCGALYLRKNPRVRILRQVHGGGQERGIRSGTVPVFLAVGLAKAVEILKKEGDKEKEFIQHLNDEFINILKKELKNDFIINGKGTFPGCLNISFPYVEGEGLLMKLKDFALSSGSACTSASLEPSYVLRALGRSDDLAHSSIRFGMGRFSDLESVKELGKQTAKAVNELREMSPLYEMAQQGIDMSTINWSA